jgi:hypothetical protein
MRTHLIHGLGRVWRAAGIALGGAAVVVTAGALGAAPAQAGGGGNEGPLVPVFVVQPSTTQLNTPVAPPVVVQVENSDGQLDWDYTGPVLLKYAVNPVGAADPTGNEVNADHGVATFRELTFGSVGFGFELVALLPGQQQEPAPSPWPWLPGGNWNWLPSLGAVSAPSAAFDIVDQILNCADVEGTCTTNTVTSAGTSGFTTATSGQLTATGGGFNLLSCTTAGGVLTFSSTEGQTITITLPGDLAGQRPLKFYNACWGAPQPFITKFGFLSRFNPANGDFEGLLPNCRPYRSGPCVQSRSRTWPWSGAVTITVLAPPGDPHITWG